MRKAHYPSSDIGFQAADAELARHASTGAGVIRSWPAQAGSACRQRAGVLRVPPLVELERASPVAAALGRPANSENRPTLGFDEDGVAQMDCARRAYLREHSHAGAMVLGGSAEDRVVAR